MVPDLLVVVMNGGKMRRNEQVPRLPRLVARGSILADRHLIGLLG